jgi:hypothetical protein
MLQNNNGRGIPKWLDVKKVVAAAVEMRAKIANAIPLKSTASTSEKRIVISYRDSKGHVISAEDPFVVAQVAKGAKPCDAHGNELLPYKMVNAHAAMADANIQSVSTEKRIATNERQIHPSYMVDSTINRHLQYKALQSLSDFANECGLYGARAKYVMGKNASVAGKQFQGYTEITADISWLVGPRFRKTVTATVGIDAGNKLVMPKVFKSADGTEHPFTKEAVGEMLKGIEFSKPSREIRRRSDVPVFKKPDPTRYKAIPK